jgi:chaperonin cofactor prefoldin
MGMEESKMHEKILVEINNRTSVINSRIDQLEEKLDALEEKLQKIFWFIEFHLGEVPLKHRKFNPSKGEYPYFKTKKDFKTMPLHPGFSSPGDNPLQEIEMPKDPNEYKLARERMLDRLKEKDKIEEVFYELSEVNLENGYQNWKHVGETLSLEEAKKWEEEGGKREEKLEGSEEVFHLPNRMYRSRTRMVLKHVPDLSDDKYYGNEQAWEEPKQESSVASSTTSAGQDLHQEDKPNESSPSSQESPDHKNPPSQI